jgi:hypothetical protein
MQAAALEPAVPQNGQSDNLEVANLDPCQASGRPYMELGDSLTRSLKARPLYQILTRKYKNNGASAIQCCYAAIEKCELSTSSKRAK